MAFPTSPTNGQTTTQNGQVYTYSSALGAWELTTSTTGAISATTITATANITGGNLLTSGLVSVTSSITGGNLITSGFASVTGNANITGNVNTGNATGVTWANASGVRVWTYYNNTTASLDTVFL